MIPAGAIQISSGEGGQSLHTLTMTNSTTGGAIVQYAQGQEFFVPGKCYMVIKNKSNPLTIYFACNFTYLSLNF